MKGEGTNLIEEAKLASRRTSGEEECKFCRLGWFGAGLLGGLCRVAGLVALLYCDEVVEVYGVVRL